MKTRSTGLGKTELVQEFRYMKPQGDYVVIGMQTVEPVKWQVRVAATHMDILSLLKILLGPKVVWWIVSGLIVGLFTGFKRAKNPRPITDF